MALSSASSAALILPQASDAHESCWRPARRLAPGAWPEPLHEPDLRHARQRCGHRESFHRRSLLNLVTEFHNGEKCFARNAAPIQAHAAQGLRFHDAHTRPNLGGSNGGDVPARSGTENGDVRLSWHTKDCRRRTGFRETGSAPALVRSGDSAFLLVGKKRVVLCRRHQCVDFAGICKINHHHPAPAVRLAVDDLRVVFQFPIDLSDVAAHGRV